MSDIPSVTSSAQKEDSYGNWSIICALIAFIATWIYAISSWGFLIGVSLGVIPALIVGILIYYFWTVILALGIFAFLGWVFLFMILNR